jgi:hypothetical protein
MSKAEAGPGTGSQSSAILQPRTDAGDMPRCICGRSGLHDLRKAGAIHVELVVDARGR